jgi:hypothetical protein
MLIRYNNEDDVKLIVDELKKCNYTNISHYMPTRYTPHCYISFKHPKISHEFRLDIKQGYSNSDVFRFETYKTGILFEMDYVNSITQKALDKKLKQQQNKNVRAVIRPMFKMYICGQIESLGGKVTVNNETVVHGTFDLCPGIVKIIINTSVKKNPELDYDERTIQIISKHFKLNFFTTLGNFVHNFPNLNAMIESMKEPTHERTTNA